MVEKNIGYVGEVTQVDADLIQTLVHDGYIPVLATVAASPEGESLNVNADIAAGEVSTAHSGAVSALPACPCRSIDTSRGALPDRCGSHPQLDRSVCSR